MRQFMRFLLGQVYQGDRLDISDDILAAALEQTIGDVRYHYQVTAREIQRRITTNQNELAVFLYRLGRQVYERTPERADALDALHWLMRSCCACEVYFSNQIGRGFYVVHGLGTVIGSRNTIGQGFHIYQGCTIGHLKDFEDGCLIGDNVIMYSRAIILGPVRIGDNVVIGSGCQIMEDVPSGTTCLAPGHQRRLAGRHPAATTSEGTP